MFPEQHIPTEEVTCMTEGVFTHALTYGQTYHVLARERSKQQIKVQGDNGRTRWFPEGCFIPGRRELPKWVHILSLDAIETPQSGSLEVTLELSTGQHRWCFFITPEGLASLGGEHDLDGARLLL